MSSLFSSVPPLLVKEVVTGSMAPVLMPGDLIRISTPAFWERGPKPQSAPVPRTGEIWAYWNAEGNAVTVHRIVKVMEKPSGTRLYRFQGDALLLPDEGGAWIEAARLFGRAEARFRNGQWGTLIGFKARILGASLGLLGAVTAVCKGSVRRLGSVSNRE